MSVVLLRLRKKEKKKLNKIKIKGQNYSPALRAAPRRDPWNSRRRENPKSTEKKKNPFSFWKGRGSFVLPAKIEFGFGALFLPIFIHLPSVFDTKTLSKNPLLWIFVASPKEEPQEQQGSGKPLPESQSFSQIPSPGFLLLPPWACPTFQAIFSSGVNGLAVQGRWNSFPFPWEFSSNPPAPAPRHLWAQFQGQNFNLPSRWFHRIPGFFGDWKGP